jgi:hypothetical protein
VKLVRVALVLLLALAVAPSAWAAEAAVGWGARSWPDHFDDRSGVTWEAGAGPWLGVWGDDGAGPFPTPGAVVVVGLHGMVPYGGGGDGLLPEIEGFRFCAPLACGALGMLFAPAGTFVGNELGIELRGAVAGSTRSDMGTLVRTTVRPFLRYAEGALRTQTLIGALSPEIGAQWHAGRGTALVLSWSIFPIDWRVAGPLTLAFDPLRTSIFVPASGPGGGEVGTEITLRFVP